MARRRRPDVARPMACREVVLVRDRPALHLQTVDGRSTVWSMDYGFGEVREVLSSACRRARLPMVLPVNDNDWN